MSARILTAALLLLVTCLAPASGEDVRLDAYVHEALRHNPVMEAGMQALLARDLERRSARARRLPSLELSARYSRQTGGRSIDFPAGQLFNPIHATLNELLEERGEPPMFPTDVQDFEEPLLRRREQDTRLQLRAPLYAPELGAAIAAAAAQTRAESARLEATARNLVREVKRAYFAAARSAAAEGILEASRELLAEDQRAAQVLLREGSATEDRVLRARAEVLAVEQRLDQARARTRQTRRQLARLLDRDDAAELVLPEVAPETLLAQELPEGEALPSPEKETPPRPELERLSRAVEAAEAGAEVRRAQSLPRLSLAADYGIEGEDYRLSRDADFATVSLVLQWNLFDFDARRASRDAAEAEAARLRAERADLEARLRQTLTTAREDLAVARRAQATAAARVEAAEAAFRIAERKREENTLSQIEFLDAERALTEARLNLVITHFALRDQRAEVELVSAGYPLPPLPLTAPEPRN
jgi:outer membrane protein TolC